MRLIVDDLSVNYEISGKGPCLLMVHGWGDDQKTFDNLRPELSKNYLVLSVDLPGFGGTQPPKEVWGLKEYGRFLAHFLEKLQQTPYAIIAHSNGASVALVATSEGLLTPSRLVLLGAAGIRDREKIKKHVIKVIAKTGKAATFWLPESKKKSLRKRLYGVSGSDMLVAPHLQETFKKTVAQDVQENATRVRLPTLLVYGDKDTATPPLYGEIYSSKMTNARLEIVSGAGHFVHNDQAEKVTKLIRDFLS